MDQSFHAFDTAHPIARERVVADLPCVWGVEMRGPSGWTLLQSVFRRRVITLASYDEAAARAVECWKRHDRPARPVRLADLG